MFVSISSIILVLIIFVNIAASESQNFRLKARAIHPLIVPMFSSNSNFSNFLETWNFFSNLPNLPKDFHIYSSNQGFHELDYCSFESNKCGDVTNQQLNNYEFLETWYTSTITSDPLGTLQLALLLTADIIPLCGLSVRLCTIDRISIILLTDYDNLTSVSYLSSRDPDLTQIFYFALLSSDDVEANNLTTGAITYYDVGLNEPTMAISDEILGEEICKYIYLLFFNAFQ